MSMKRRSPSLIRIRDRLHILQQQRDADTKNGITNPIVTHRIAQLESRLRVEEAMPAPQRSPSNTEAIIAAGALRAQEDTQSLMRRYTAWRGQGDAELRVMRLHAHRLFSPAVTDLFQLQRIPSARSRGIGPTYFVWGTTTIRGQLVDLHVWQATGHGVQASVVCDPFRAPVAFAGLDPFSAFNRLCAVLAEMFSIVPMPGGWHDPLGGQPYDSRFDSR